jgi:hypothetical protein
MRLKHTTLPALHAALALAVLASAAHAQAQAPAAPPTADTPAQADTSPTSPPQAPGEASEPREATQKPARATSPATPTPPAAQKAPASPLADETASPSPSTPAGEGQSGRAWIAHLPISSASLDDIRLRFDVRGNDLAGEIVVYFRALGSQGAVRSVRAKRDEKSFAAQIPSDAVESDGIEYWVVERDVSGEERAVFASSSAPQPVFTYVDSTAAREQRLLRMADGKRSRVTGRFEWVDMGGFRVNNPAVGDEHDRYLRAEVQYDYRFFRGVEELQFALGWLDGELLNTDTLDREPVGLQYGRTAITFALGDWLRLRPGVLLGISEQGFEAGVDAAALFGDRDGTEFELSGGFVSHLGARVGTRLGWCTVPRVPMGASIEVTSFPSNEEYGVRLLFDIGYRFLGGLTVRAIAGYRGRTSLAGGPSLGVEAGYAF